MAITFPSSPSVNQVFTSGNKSWKWTGTEWIGNFSGSVNADTIDTLDSTQFVRSDTSDIVGGNLTFTAEPTFSANTTWFGTSSLGSGIRMENISNTHARMAFNDWRLYDWGTGRDIVTFNNGTTFDANVSVNSSYTITSSTFSGRITASGDGQNNIPFRLETDYSSYLVGAAGNTWGLFWAGNSGAAFGTNGVGGPGNIWGNSGNPNEFVFVGSGSTRWTVYGNNGNTWQSGTLTTVGDITSGGQVTANSDIRLKTDIRPIDDPLSIVSKLNGYLYTKDGLENQVGVIAQEVEEVLPSMVLTSDDEMQTKSVNYGNLVAVLIEAMKEQQKRIEALEEKLNGNNT